MQALALGCTFAAVVTLVLATQRGIEIAFERCEARYSAASARNLDALFLFLPPRAVTYMALAAGVSLGASTYLISSSLTLAALASILGLAGPQVGLKYLLARRKRLTAEQLPDALSLMSNSLRAGLSLSQALGLAAREMPPPVSQELAVVSGEMKLGISLEVALEHLRQRLPGEDIELAVTAILISHQVGGNLCEVLERIASTTRERLSIQGRVSALTAQGRMQAVVVGLVPFGVGTALYFLDRDLMMPLFTTCEGWGLLTVFFALQTAGCLLLRKMVRIDA